MEKFIAHKITGWCFKQNSVTDIQRTAIEYGVELFLDSLLKIVLLVCIGVLLGKGRETVIVVGCFCLLRKEAGGIHMKTGIGCFLSMFLMTTISIVGAEFITNISAFSSMVVCLIALIVTFYYAPYSTPNNPIIDENIIKQKKYKAMITIIILAFITIIVQSFIRALILIPVIIEIITILPFWRRKEVSDNEKGALSE